MTMDIKILVDYGQGYNAAMTVSDARRLFESLKEVFEAKESLEKARERILEDIRDEGLIAGGPGVAMALNAEAKRRMAEESPETLREAHNAPFFGTPCNCKDNEHGADCYPEVHS